MIRTVLGDISADKLGHVQCHEHIFLEKDKSYEVSSVLYMDDFEKSLGELNDYKEAGGGTIVDAQPVLSGRMAENLIKASKKSGVNIVASTGFHKAVFYYDDSYIFTDDEDKITQLYIDEIKDAMLGSKSISAVKVPAKAGMIKTAVDSFGIAGEKVYEKLFSAAANACTSTGAPVMCHIEKGADALETVEFFTKRGVDPSHIIICHLDRAKYDKVYHKEVLATGVYFDYDTVNRLKYLSHEQELEIIAAMLEAGYGDKIMLSLDTTNARLRAYGADMGLDYILKSFIPMMKKYGISDEDILKMTKENAKKALSFWK